MTNRKALIALSSAIALAVASTRSIIRAGFPSTAAFCDPTTVSTAPSIPALVPLRTLRCRTSTFRAERIKVSAWRAPGLALGLFHAVRAANQAPCSPSGSNQMAS
jgi:hypothetical protein